MPLLRRHKYTLLILLIYWPALFVLMHIPIPDLARRSGMSDKIMHALAYLTLVFLWWFAISPYRKVDWRKAKAWLALAVMVWYGAFDEWLQGRIGRSVEVADFYADLAGVLCGLMILSIFSFWPASLIVSAAFIFAVINLSKIDLLWEWPFLMGMAVLKHRLSFPWVCRLHTHLDSVYAATCTAAENAPGQMVRSGIKPTCGIVGRC